MEPQGPPVQDAHPTTYRKKQSGRAKLIGATIAILVLGGLGWLAWNLTHSGPIGGDSARPGGRRGAPATTVGVATAERADIPVVLDALGTVLPAANVVVRPQVSGVLQQVLFREGDMVKAGQVLATIDPRVFENALAQASGQRQRDEAQLEVARLTLQRYRTLLEQDSIARQEVDTQAALVKQLEGSLVTNRAAENTARLNLGYSKVVAPISGRAGLRAVDAGNIVNANDAGGIVTITQVSPIDVQFAVPQDQVPEVHARSAGGAALPVTALDRGRANTLDTGTFSTLDNQVDTQTGTVRAKARFANSKLTLFPNQFVNVRLQLNTIAGAVVIPVAALRHGSSGDFVYVLNEAERTVALRPVTRGQSTTDKIEIATGLKAGEKVITEGADRLKDGAKVTLAGDKPQSGGPRSGRPGRDKRGADGASPRSGSADSTGPATPGATPSASAPSASAPSQSAPATSTGASATAGSASSASAPERRQRPPAEGKEAKPDAAAGAPAPAASSAGPTAEQRQRVLERVKDDPEKLAQRKAFLEKLDKGDPAALERWQKMLQRGREGNGAPGQ
ncbi:hypothetical protein BH11PSE11_BH11PSE11_22350 [soil metagenome]